MNMVTIPAHIEPVSQDAMDRLTERLWAARVAMRDMPLAMNMRAKWKVYFRNREVEAVKAAAMGFLAEHWAE